MSKERKYTDFSNVETGRTYMIQEEFPEGPVGSPVNMKLGKSTPWEGNERHYTPFNYEYKNLHEGLERQMPGAHVTHDDPDTHVQEPYDDYPNP